MDDCFARVVEAYSTALVLTGAIDRIGMVHRRAPEPRFRERLWVIFQALANRDDLESSGIGLGIVEKRVEEHDGPRWVESAPPERGTTIVFTWKEPTA